MATNSRLTPSNRSSSSFSTCYLVFNFTWETILLSIIVAAVTAILYLFLGKKRLAKIGDIPTAIREQKNHQDAKKQN
ncbi:hypothetical protein CCE30_01925 [Lactobacillus gasseri]|uniref:Uncharacterized protein n=1 Tax=Lactobacillus gasseri TaxID=1596 RepID=A0AB33C3E2_LACGS|nr:hypothetical protein CCE30_01925 [Lactobacillus gasseri]